MRSAGSAKSIGASVASTPMNAMALCCAATTPAGKSLFPMRSTADGSKCGQQVIRVGRELDRRVWRRTLNHGKTFCRSSRLDGFTIVELLVVIAITTLLIATLLPVLSSVRESARTTLCLSNLRQVGAALQSYAIDHNGHLVPGDHWGRFD